MLQPKLVEDNVLPDDDKLRDKVAQHDTDIAILQHRMDDHRDILGQIQRDTKAIAEMMVELTAKLERRIGFRAGSLWLTGIILVAAGAVGSFFGFK